MAAGKCAFVARNSQHAELQEKPTPKQIHTLMTHTLFRHQQALVDKFPKRHLMAWQVRTGKTLTSIHLANKANLSTLIIVPKGLKKQWGEEILEHATLPKVLVLTKEEFRRDAKSLPKFDTLIVDEAHHFSGMKSILSRYLEAYIKKHNPEHVYLLTGTPYRSTPWNIYRLAAILGHKWNYAEFRRQFFYEKYLGKGVVFVPKPNCQEALAEMVREIGSIVRLEDCTDMPKDPVPIITKVKATPEQLALMAEVAQNESNPLVRFGKYHQIASGILIGNEYEESREVPSGKDTLILDRVAEHERALIFCRYNLQIDRYAKLLKENDIPYIIINGKTKDIDAAREAVRNLRYGAALINMSMSEGYDFSGYSYTAYASMSYSYLDFEQSQGRTKHILKTVPNMYEIFITEGSADEPVAENIENKQSFSEAIFTREHLARFEESIINQSNPS
jgi:superfamily II DNA or RNA helicase